ncbi:MAG: hypothetical protein ACRBCT_10025 [Alphaproteobacteria bacterium]
MKRYTSKLLFSASILVGLAFTAPVAAQGKAPAFKPAQGWEVGSYEPVTQFSGQCRLQTHFDNGFIMQFRADSSWVQALDINFRQDIFETGKAYKGTLSTPDGVKAAVNASALSANTLSLPIKGEKALFAALKKQAVLDLDVEGNAFRFFLTGFAPAATQFETCMSGKNQPAIAAQVPQAAPEYSNRITAKDDFTVNEAVAMEKAEAATKIDLMSGADIPYANDHEIIEHTTNAAPIAPKAMARPDVSPHRRLSDQLAEEIASNPDLVDAETDAVKTQTFDKDAPKVTEIRRELVVPKGFDEALIEKEAAPISEVMPAPAKPAPEEKPIETAPVEKSEKAEKPKLTTVTIGGRRIIQSAPILPADQAITLDGTAKTAVKVEVKEEAVLNIAEPTPPVETEMDAKPTSPALPLPSIKAEEIVEVGEPKTILPKPDIEITVEKSPKSTFNPKVTKERFVGEADFTNIPSASTKLNAGMANASLARLSILERELEMIRAENIALNEELESSLKEGETERLTVSSENWNLEQATKRYNEAERQIKRLGLQLQKERAQAALEKQELEAMLFDPELTEQAQLARLSQLEKELEAARAALKATGVAGN